MADLSNSTPAPSTATLAREFILALVGAGHRPYISGSGRFGVRLSVSPRQIREPVHHNGAERVYTLGFDDRPFAALRDDPNWIAVVAAQLSN